MDWPENKDFAFTIIDDTDNATLDNIKPIYDFLLSKNIKTTKTVWIYEPRDNFYGDTILNKNYLNFLLKLMDKGVDIQLHNVGSGKFVRDEIIKGLDIFKEKIGKYPSMHINHSTNIDSMYWGKKRFGSILKNILTFLRFKNLDFYGDDIDSKYFWGDYSKKYIKFIRNRVFDNINTLKCDPKMPFIEKNKVYANYWFSSSDGHSISEFNTLLSKKNVDKLKKEKGLCIVYTHFACGFLETNGNINSEFKNKIDYLSKQNGWFVPANEILEYLITQKQEEKVSSFYINLLDFKWILDRIFKKMKFGK